MAGTKKTKKRLRPKPVAAKAGLSKNPKRRYSSGGTLFCKGGKLK